MPVLSIPELIDARGDRFRMKATAFGTVNGPYGILHTDPKGSDPQAREPLVHEAEAELLEKAGLAKRIRTIEVGVPDEVPDGEKFDAYGSYVAQKAAERMAGVAEIEAGAGVVTGLDSRMTSHHGDGRLDVGTTSAPVAVDDAEAPPTSGKGKASPKSAAQPAEPLGEGTAPPPPKA